MSFWREYFTLLGLIALATAGVLAVSLAIVALGAAIFTG
jgi:hypothetical protein